MGNFFLEQAKNVASQWRVLSPGDKIIKPKLAKQDKDDSAKDRYDVILGIDLLTGLELNKKNQDMSLKQVADLQKYPKYSRLICVRKN